MGLFDGINNPWAPGGQMSTQMPWAQPGLNHGWGHGNEFFAPKTKQQIALEGYLQMAVIAAVVVAPLVLGAQAAAAGASTASVGVSAEAAGAVVAQGAGVTAAGAGLSASTGIAVATGLGASAVLQPFLQQNSATALQKAAAMGEVELNRTLHQLSGSGVQRVEAQEDWPQTLSSLDQMTPRVLETNLDLPLHEAVPMLVELAEKIQRLPSLHLVIKKAMLVNPFRPELTSEVVREVHSLINRQLERFDNPWVRRNTTSEAESIMKSTQNSTPVDAWTFEQLRGKVERSRILKLLEKRVYQNPETGFDNTFDLHEKTWRNPIQVDLPEDGPPSRISFRHKDIELASFLSTKAAATMYSYELQHAVNYKLGEKGDHPENYLKEEYLDIVFEMETDAQITAIEYEIEAEVDVMAISDDIKFKLKFLINKFRVDYQLNEDQLVSDFRVNELQYSRKKNRSIQKIRDLANPRFRPGDRMLPYYTKQWERNH